MHPWASCLTFIYLFPYQTAESRVEGGKKHLKRSQGKTTQYIQRNDNTNDSSLLLDTMEVREQCKSSEVHRKKQMQPNILHALKIFLKKEGKIKLFFRLTITERIHCQKRYTL